MNPTFLNNMSWEMAEVYGAITDQILINLARYFPYFKAGNVPRSAFTYQAAMLAQMGQVNKDTIRIIRNNLQGANKALSNVLEQTVIDAVSKAEPGLLKAVKAGIFSPAGIPIVAPNQMRAFQLYYQQASDKLNLVNTVMLESTQQAYQACVSDVVAGIELSDRMNATQIALDVATGETVTGVSSWNQSLRHAMDRLKDRGITGFIDHAGHRWSAEGYVAMDIRTTVFNTGRAAVWETNQNFGNDLYIVSYHDGARPLCFPWQNKVISSTNSARTVVDLDGNEVQVYAQSETSYGEAAGLFGINCKHYPSPFIPGVSVAYDQGNILPEKENEKIYEQTQQQRGLERKLREEKRDLLMAKAQGAPDEEIKALRAKCRETSNDIDTFCEETGLPRRQNREGVFTKRDFPDADKYDVSEFERTQKEEIEKYFSGGGSQQGYTFGQMTPNEPIVPAPVPTPTPISTPVAQNVAQQATSKATPMVQYQPGVRNVKDFAEYKKYMSDIYGIDVTAGVKKLDFDLVKEATEGFEILAHDYPEVAKGIQKMRLSKSGIMSCNGTEITFNSDYFMRKDYFQRTIEEAVKRKWWPQNTSVASIGAHETAHGLEMVLIEKSGKYTTQMSKALAWNNCYEARDIVKEACDEIMKTPAGQGKSAFDLIGEMLSGYGKKGGNSESMAEAFADVFANGDNATPLAKAIVEATKRKYSAYLGVNP